MAAALARRDQTFNSTRERLPELWVRIFPDEFGVDYHDERLTVVEEAAGGRYWQRHGDDASNLQAWEELARQFGAPRAAWIVQATNPERPKPVRRSSAYDARVTARLLPERFAFVAIGDAMPRNLRGANSPTYVTWGAPIPQPLSFDVFAKEGGDSWQNDFDAAVRAGMAARIPISKDAAPIQWLLVMGVRDDASVELNSLLSAHAFSAGFEVLPDGAPTNNSDHVRAVFDRNTQSEIARLLSSTGATDEGLPPGSAGSELSALLGVHSAVFRGVRGAYEPHGTLQAALSLLVRFGVSGKLRDSLNEAAGLAELIAPSGPVPTLRIGRQPYGILPVSAVGRWKAQSGEASAPLAQHLRRWGYAIGSQLAIDPRDRPVPALGEGAGRAVAEDDSSEFPTLALEMAHSFAWQSASESYAGPAALIGATEGEQAPNVYLSQIADTATSALADLHQRLPSLLARVAIAAKQNAPNEEVRTRVNAALRQIAASFEAAPTRHGELVRAFSATLDSTSHRFDAWVTSVVKERLIAQRSAPGARTAVGAYGWLSNLRPADARRSEGHVLAPSLAHAASGAVLRAGYLAQRQKDEGRDGSRQPLAVDLSSSRVRSALATLSAVRAGQPLGAVLGRAFEDDLVSSHLQQYLATFRKLTRFPLGSDLDVLAEARRRAQVTVAKSEEGLATLIAKVQEAKDELEAAGKDLEKALNRESAAEAQAAPYLAMRKRLDQLPAIIDGYRKALIAIDNDKQPTGSRTIEINVP